MSAQLLGNLIVALLGLATSANWLVRGDARRLTRIRAEAELVGLLPESDAKNALVQKVAADVLSHIDLSRSAPARRIRNSAKAVFAIEAVVAVASITLIVIAVFANPTPRWMTYGIWTATGVLVLLTVGLGLLSRRNDQVTSNSEQDAENGVRISDLIARVSAHPVPEADGTASHPSDDPRTGFDPGPLSTRAIDNNAPPSSGIDTHDDLRIDATEDQA